MLSRCCYEKPGWLWGTKKKILNFSFKENINEQWGSSLGVGENWTRSCNWQWPPAALPGLASRPSSVGSVIKQCCLAVQDLELLPTSVAVNSSLKVASFDTASQSHCPFTYDRDGTPCAAPQALAFGVNTAPWCSGLNSGCAGFLSWVLCAAVTWIRGVFLCGERCFSAGKLLSSVGCLLVRILLHKNLPL